MYKRLVLSLFPGVDLMGKAFEEVGYTVLRGPDILWGGDIRGWHIPPDIFEGVIGGPPCKCHSKTKAMSKAREDGLISEFVRVVGEASPRWSVMENVLGARRSAQIPEGWFAVRLRDWDCGGLTFRTRMFWVWPGEMILSPAKRPGKPQYSVLATSYRTRSVNPDNRNFRGHEYISLHKAAELQGYPEMEEYLDPIGRQAGSYLLGNGVPRAMGLYIAKQIMSRMEVA